MTHRIVDEPPLEISAVKTPVATEQSAHVPSYLENLVRQARGLNALRTAVVHPVDGAALCGAIEAARAQLINPVLIGPEAKIRAAAHAAHIDLSDYELVATEHSHAAAAAAVALARERLPLGPLRNVRIDAPRPGAQRIPELQDKEERWPRVASVAFWSR